MFEKAIKIILSEPPEPHYPAYYADLLREADVPDKNVGKCSETPNNSDSISRQAAIDAIESTDWYHIKDGELVHGANSKEDEPLYKAKDIYSVIENLPSVHPEKHTEERAETHACDLIDRQAAIDAVERIFDRCEEIEVHLPEGDPDRIGYKMFPDYMTVWKYLHQLPPAQPVRKTGKWLDAVLPNDNGGLPVQVCDQCKTFFPLAYTGGGHHFCPNCGADMRGEQDE